MSAEEKLYTALTGSTLITTTTTRIIPVHVRQRTTLPYIVYTRISGSQYNGLAGYLDTERPAIQVDVYSTSFSQAKSLAENVHTVLDATTTIRAVLVSDNDLFEDEIDSYRVSMDFSCINHE